MSDGGTRGVPGACSLVFCSWIRLLKAEWTWTELPSPLGLLGGSSSGSGRRGAGHSRGGSAPHIADRACPLGGHEVASFDLGVPWRVRARS